MAGAYGGVSTLDRFRRLTDGAVNQSKIPPIGSGPLNPLGSSGPFNPSTGIPTTNPFRKSPASIPTPGAIQPPVIPSVLEHLSGSIPAPKQTVIPYSFTPPEAQIVKDEPAKQTVQYEFKAPEMSMFTEYPDQPTDGGADPYGNPGAPMQDPEAPPRTTGRYPVYVEPAEPALWTGSPSDAFTKVPGNDKPYTPSDYVKPTFERPAPVDLNNPQKPPGASSDDVYQSVLDTLSGQLKSDQPLPGTKAAITQSREALATYAKSAEARAGMAAAKSNSLGQGTANAMGDATRQDVLGHLANSELNNTQLVSNEKQKLLDTATQVGQFGKNQAMDQQRIDVQKGQFDVNTGLDRERIANQKSQFDVNTGITKEQMATQVSQFKDTLAQNKEQFEKTFGQTEAKLHTDTLERLAQDNPVLAKKLTDSLLGGKPVGEFTPEELTQLKEYTAKKTVQDDKLQEVMNKILESVPAQIAASTKAAKDALAEAEKAKTIETLKAKISSNGTLSPEDIQLAKEEKLIDSKTSSGGGASDITGDGAAAWLKQHPDQNLILDGKAVKVVKGGHYTIEYNPNGRGLAVDFTQINYNGTDYWVDSKGYWYAKNPVSFERNGEMKAGANSIANPLK